MDWIRATTSEKKNERKEAIFDAAFSLFKKRGYEKVSFNGIATEAGFTKSNMYRYFNSKEDIFLSIFASLFQLWVDDYCQRLAQFEQNEHCHIFAKTWVDSFISHPHLLELTPLLFISLESNGSYQQLLEFKRLSKGLLYRVVVEINRIYPNFDIEKAFKLLTMSYAATANHWAAATQNEALDKIYQLDEFKELKPDFEEDLRSSIEIIINGIKAI